MLGAGDLARPNAWPPQPPARVRGDIRIHPPPAHQPADRPGAVTVTS
jgi:hypothetical protein